MPKKLKTCTVPAALYLTTKIAVKFPEVVPRAQQLRVIPLMSTMIFTASKQHLLQNLLIKG